LELLHTKKNLGKYTMLKTPRYIRNKDGVLTPKEGKEFSYSDGDLAEESLKQFIGKAEDKSVLSSQFVRASTDWVKRYHLSPQRAHLLRPLQHLLQDKLVLELGAGCGAITRFLGETARRVVSVEGSLARASIAALRCSDLESVTVINDTIQNVQIPQRFDVVTLIGVLEYARKFDHESDNPELNVLQIARNFLKPGGHLILAIENQLGMKYLAGSKEDHEGKYFFGVHDLYKKDTVVTFGRQELEEMLFDAGFAATHQLIPLPDYKMPVTVLHPGSFMQKSKEKESVNIFQFVLNSFFYDWQKPSPHCFSLEAASRPLIRNGLLKDLCNSLFFVASVDKGASPLQPDILISHYGAARLKEFAKETLFIKNNNKVTVVRNYLDKNISHATGKLSNTISHLEEYVYLETLHERLVGVVNQPGWTVQDIVAWAAPWIGYLARLAEKQDDGMLALPPNAMDMVPFNFFIDANDMVIPFDVEWNLVDAEKLSLQCVLLRGLFITFCAFSTVARPSDDVPLNLIELSTQVLVTSGITVKAHDVVVFLTRSIALAEEALGSNTGVEGWLDRTLDVRVLA